MTPQERQVLADLFERIRSAAAAPRDAEAEAFIAEAVRAQPYAPYLLAQTALVQQHALDAAAQRIQELEAKAAATAAGIRFPRQSRPLAVRRRPAGARPGYDASAYQRARPVSSAVLAARCLAAVRRRRGPAMTRAPISAPPRRLRPPLPRMRPAAGPWGAPPAGSGGGFLASAMTTATGVAGGLLAANAIESLLGGGRGGLFGGYGGGGFGGGETVVNNFYDAPQSGRRRRGAAWRRSRFGRLPGRVGLRRRPGRRWFRRRRFGRRLRRLRRRRAAGAAFR